VLHNYLHSRNAEAQDDQIVGPKPFKGMPERGGTMMADQQVTAGSGGPVPGYVADSAGGEFSPPDDFNALYPKSFAMDGRHGMYDRMYEYERVKAAQRDVRHEREARAQPAQDTAIASGQFLSRLADRRRRLAIAGWRFD